MKGSPQGGSPLLVEDLGLSGGECLEDRAGFDR